MREKILLQQPLFQKKLHYQTDKPSTQSTKERADEIYRGTLR